MILLATLPLFSLVIVLLVILIIVCVGYFVISKLPLPEPIRSIAIVVLVVIAALVLIYVLLDFAGLAGSGTVLK